MSIVKISVIITAYNIEKYIEESIRSILKQDIQEIEIICVDDASKDNTHSILEKISKEDDRIRIIRNDINLGPASSRNIGCRIAKGHYLYMLDGDDYLKQGALKKLYNCAEDNKVDVLTFSGKAFVDSEKVDRQFGNQLKIYMRKGLYEGVYTGIELFSEMMKNGDKHGNICFQFINRSFFVKNDLYAIEGLRCGEDSPFAIFMAAQRAMCIPDVLYCRRFREDSIVTSKKNVNYLESVLIQYVADLFLWQSKKYTENKYNKIENHFIRQLRIIKDMIDKIPERDEMNLLNKYPVAKHIYKYLLRDESVFCELLTDDILEQVKKYNNIIVYGAGVVASYVVKRLRDYKIVDYYVSVSDNTKGKQCVDDKVYNIVDLAEKAEDSVVLVAVGDKYKEEIRESLKRFGFIHVIDVSMY